MNYEMAAGSIPCPASGVDIQQAPDPVAALHRWASTMTIRASKEPRSAMAWGISDYLPTLAEYLGRGVKLHVDHIDLRSQLF